MVDNERLQDINKHPYPYGLAVHAQSMIFYANRNPCQHGSRAWRIKIIFYAPETKPKSETCRNESVENL